MRTISVIKRIMIVYNTTYTTTVEDARNFVIWANESFIARTIQDGRLTNARLLRILSHKDEHTECFSLQFDVKDTATLHQWFVAEGKELNNEMNKLFDGRVIGFSTIMETITED